MKDITELDDKENMMGEEIKKWNIKQMFQAWEREKYCCDYK